MGKLLGLLLLLLIEAAQAQTAICSVQVPGADKSVILQAKPKDDILQRPEIFSDESARLAVSVQYIASTSTLKTFVYGYINDRKVALFAGEHVMLCSRNIITTNFGAITIYAPPYYNELNLSCWLACGSQE